MDSVETDRTVRAVSRIGAMLPAYCTAVGKVQLAQLAAADVERMYPEGELLAVTPKTITSPAVLVAELKKTLERGYALENEETELEVRSIAAPVRDFSKKVIAAVGIVAPASRLTDERIEKNKIVAMLIDAGDAISAKMGCSGPLAKK
jgi:DNA-binding IclR family transcriptional regulator